MLRAISFTVAGFFSSLATANTLDTPFLTVGVAVNTWTQGGVRVSERPFDLAVQGNGFFSLQLQSGEQVFSRYGDISLDNEGFLIQTSGQARVLGYCGGELQPINLAQFARDDKNSVAKSFRVELSGKITAIYESGYAHETCTVALALFYNANKLKRSKHLLRPTLESGEASIGKPRQEGRGSIFGSSMEELEEQMYELNVKTSSHCSE